MKLMERKLPWTKKSLRLNVALVTHGGSREGGRFVFRGKVWGTNNISKEIKRVEEEPSSHKEKREILKSFF